MHFHNSAVLVALVLGNVSRYCLIYYQGHGQRSQLGTLLLLLILHERVFQV